MPLEITYPNNGEGIEVCALGHINHSEILEAYDEIYRVCLATHFDFWLKMEQVQHVERIF
jgi:ACT domain-containing protein